MNREGQTHSEACPPVGDDDLPPRLTVADTERDAALARVAGYKHRMAEDAAKLQKPRGRPGRDGNKLDLVDEQAADANLATTTVRNIANDPVEWLFARKSLTPRQYEGALRLRDDAEKASIGTNRSLGLQPTRVSGGKSPGEIADEQLDSLRRKALCLKQLGATGAYLVQAVVLDCRPLKDVGERMGMDKNYRAPRLAEALDTVADFYRV